MQFQKLLIMLAICVLVVLPVYAQTVKPATIQPTSAASGEEMYKEYCAVCHGLDGMGKGPAAPAMTKPPTDLTAMARKNNGAFPATRVMESIRGDLYTPAHCSKDMPVWGRLFSSLDSNTGLVQLRLSNLTNHIKTMQK